MSLNLARMAEEVGRKAIRCWVGQKIMEKANADLHRDGSDRGRPIALLQKRVFCMW
jgi:hypothetical protein